MLYQLKIPLTVDALKDADGNYVIIKNGKPVLIPAAEFESQYTPKV